MGSFFKKDVLVFWRDRKEILMALLLPIIIIVVLNFAFSGLFNKDGASINLDVAIVQENDDSIGLEHSLVHDLFNDPELKQWVNVQELSEVEATELLENGELDAIIKVPEDFTYERLSSQMLGEEEGSALTIQAEEQSLELTALQDIIDNFINTLNLQFALGQTAGVGLTEPELPQGGREVVEGGETYSPSQYFTIAISTLFALFMAQTLAMKTVTEKRERVFNRIILTNSHPLHYLMGKTLSTFWLTWVQMMITFTLTQLLLDVFPGKSAVFWLGLILMITAFALTVAGLSAIFTTITLNVNDLNAASGLFTLIIIVLGVLGGSFFPIQGFPELIQNVGEWIPNGLTQTALIKWIQFANPLDLILPCSILIGYFIVFIVMGISFFPRRGRI